MGIKLKNNAVSLITTPISASDVGLAVTAGDGSKFPVLSSGDYFYATLTSLAGTSEIVKVTARAGDTMTIVRAQEGTSANSFPADSRIELRVTVGNVEGGTYTPDGSGAVSRTLQAKLRETVSVKDFGAVGDGVTDDTAAIQATLTQSTTVYFPPGTYAISGIIFVPSNRTIYAYGATLFCLASASSGTGLYITDATYTIGVENVTIYGLKVDGNRGGRTPPGAGALFYISSGKNHTLVDCKAVNSTIDGFEVAGDTSWAGGVNENTRFYNCEADNSYRNGLSVVGTDNFADYGGKYHDTNGTNPEIGVDIEPNGATSRNYGFAFYGTHVYDNASHGISVNASSGTNSTGLMSGVVSTGNGGYGFQCDRESAYIRITAPQADNNTLGSFDSSSYAFDQDNLSQRTIYSARVRKSTSQNVTSATFVDVTSTTVTYTPTYVNSGTRLRVKGNYSLINSAGTIVSASIQLINVGTSAVVDDCSPIIQANNNGANALRQDGTFFLAGQQTNVGVTPVSYKVQAKLNSGTSIDIGSVEVVAEEINFG